jgi:hypothetical protein
MKVVKQHERELDTYDYRVDRVSDNRTYYGLAAAGSLGSAAVWRIWVEDSGSSGNIKHYAEVGGAGGDPSDDFVHVWDDRATLFAAAPTGPGGAFDINVFVSGGFELPQYDYVALTEAATTDTYVFRTGGSGGTIVATIVVTFTDSTKATLANAERTT